MNTRQLDRRGDPDTTERLQSLSTFRARARTTQCGSRGSQSEHHATVLRWESSLRQAGARADARGVQRAVVVSGTSWAS